MDKQKSSFSRIRTWFLTGLVICAPLFITVYLIWNFTIWIDSWIIPYIPNGYNLPVSLPGVGLLIILGVITLIGFLTANLIGRSIVSWGERILARMPVVRNIYSALKQIFQTAFQENANHFNTVVLVEYPRKGIWAIAFVTTNTQGEVKNKINKKIKGGSVSVFLPTTPNPTSGFLLFVPKKDIIELDMSVEQAAKLIISAGLVAPEIEKKKKEAVKKKRKNQPARKRRTASSREKR